jgi:ABC-type proline/glycine betaine transport system substrate-binding protein
VKKMSNEQAAAAFVSSHAALVKSWLSGPDSKLQAPAPGT